MRHEAVFRRRTGFSRPWNEMQILSWVSMVIMLGLNVFVTLSMPGAPYITTTLIIGEVWVMLCVIFCTLADPSYGGNIVPVALDRTKHSHAIENDFCNICQMKV